jgi:hypothetical protein
MGHFASMPDRKTGLFFCLCLVILTTNNLVVTLAVIPSRIL